MNMLGFDFCGAGLAACGSGALWWASERMLCVSDLHLGKSGRTARRGGGLLPPYETEDTLNRLAQDIATLKPRVVVALGDSFDDMDAAAETIAEAGDRFLGLMAGRRWIWIAGNHDPAPLTLGGTHLAQIAIGPLTFRHEAAAGARAEVSGHYHPKAAVPVGGRGVSRPAFLWDENRLILPAYGTYTGGLRTSDRAFCGLMQPRAWAILTGPKPVRIPLIMDAEGHAV